MEQNNPILKLFSMLSGILDSPPNIQKQDSTNNLPSQKNTANKTPTNNKASTFISSHDKLSQKIKNNNK